MLAYSKTLRQAGLQQQRSMESMQELQLAGTSYKSYASKAGLWPA
jgi:hypothetical protein